MADEPEDVAAEETTSEEAAPAEEEPSETTSGEQEPGEEPGDEEPSEEEPAAEEADASTEEPEETDDTEPPTTPAAKRAWDNLEAKFAWIKDPEDRKEAVAKAYWEKARYDKQIRQENADLKAENERLKAQVPKPEEKPAEPHPDVVRIEARIQALYDRSQNLQTQQKERLVQLNKLDRAVAIAEDRLTDAFDEQKPAVQARLEAAQRNYDLVKDQWIATNERIAELDEKVQQELANRDWVIRFQQEQAQRNQSEAQSRQEFMADFPKHVDTLITSTAEEMGLPKDEKIRASLWKHVNRALMVDLRAMNVPDISQVNIPGMVAKFVKEYAEDRDLVRRKAFKATSDAKLAVTTRPAVPGVRKAPAAPPRPVPGSARPAIPASLLGGDRSPAMERARQVLVKRFG